MLEGAQKRVTKVVKGLEDKSDEKWLRELGLGPYHSLQLLERRL